MNHVSGFPRKSHLAWEHLFINKCKPLMWSTLVLDQRWGLGKKKKLIITNTTQILFMNLSPQTSIASQLGRLRCEKCNHQRTNMELELNHQPSLSAFAWKARTLDMWVHKPWIRLAARRFDIHYVSFSLRYYVALFICLSNIYIWGINCNVISGCK